MTTPRHDPLLCGLIGDDGGPACSACAEELFRQAEADELKTESESESLDE